MASAAIEAEHGTTADPDEVRRFTAMADEWWDASGKFRPLHQLAPVRLAFIRDCLCDHFGLDAESTKPLEGLTLLDIGCGGGLLAEPMTRLGASVTGIDASERNIAVARLHAEEMGLDIDYRHQLPEALAEMDERFDVVLNMEVVEHVADVAAFLGASVDLMAPGGAMVVSTLNRTPKSLLLAKVGAEYILRWLPIGTHDWKKFVRPSELAKGLRPQGAEIRALKGMSYDPLADEWRLGDDLAVNYLAFVTRP